MLASEMDPSLLHLRSSEVVNEARRLNLAPLVSLSRRERPLFLFLPLVLTSHRSSLFARNRSFLGHSSRDTTNVSRLKPRAHSKYVTACFAFHTTYRRGGLRDRDLAVVHAVHRSYSFFRPIVIRTRCACTDSRRDIICSVAACNVREGKPRRKNRGNFVSSRDELLHREFSISAHAKLL